MSRLDWDWMHTTLFMMSCSLREHLDCVRDHRTTDPAHTDKKVVKALSDAQRGIRDAMDGIALASKRVEEVRAPGAEGGDGSR